ncbi:MAG: hypothetical protein OXU78_05190 [Deltaproteobacteria bacterium]|nr:hypothetical protein [Deltaproteobacteria bacterium]MDD9827284.1 hypothetical protein [Deltaproteobacteria bacterium]MDD9853333.1 hypothetical protein [Deltaproteobacteria bacterium]MDD9872058.1 hypothetical protein [Deltaproteobacteria bacterium]
MSGSPRLRAMASARPAPTPMAPPRPPDRFPAGPRYRSYLLFGMGSALMLPLGFELLCALWALASGDAAWREFQAGLRHPLRIAGHAVAGVWLTWVALRFFRLFPKTQPFRLGPFRRPPDWLLVGGLYGVFAAASLALGLWLAGRIGGLG